MSFNLGNPTGIWPGVTHHWTYWLNDHEDQDSQIATANITTPGATLVANNQGKRIDNNVGVTYTVTITNISGQVGFYNLQGGGLE
jgi:hypothetical protein